MTHPRRKWDTVVTLDAVDITARVAGTVLVEQIEGGSARASFDYLPPVGAIDPNDWSGKVVTIDLEGEDQVLVRSFTGVVDTPSYNPHTRRAFISCTQNRDELLGAYDAAAQESLIGGYYSAHVFDGDADLPRQAEDRLRTVSASLDFDGSNTAVLTDWAAKATPDITLSGADMRYRTPVVTLASRDSLRNQITVKFSYRFTRLRHREHAFTWDFPDGGGTAASNWVGNPTSIAFRDQVLQAAEATGLVLKSGYSFDDFAASGWYNGVSFGISDLERAKYCLGADFSLLQRFTQDITEDYEITVSAPQSVTQYGSITESATYGVVAEYNSTDWDNLDSFQAAAGTLSANGDYIQDKTEDGLDGSRTEFNEAIKAAQAVARVQILAGHRKNYVDVVTKYLRPDIGLHHTLKIDTAEVVAQGKVVKITHKGQIDQTPRSQGTTAVRIAISKIGNSPPTETAIAVPTAPDTSDAGPAPVAIVLGNHYGNHAASPPYDDEWNGNIGNYVLHDAVQTMEIYPEAFVVDVPEVADADRDNREVTAASTHEIEIPNETLTMN